MPVLAFYWDGLYPLYWGLLRQQDSTVSWTSELFNFFPCTAKLPFARFLFVFTSAVLLLYLKSTEKQRYTSQNQCHSAGIML